MDIEYLLLLQKLRFALGESCDSLMTFASDNLIYLFLLAAFYLYWCKDKKKGLYALFSYEIAGFLNSILKMLACAYRPWIRDARVQPSEGAKVHATGYSFPSGHTMCGSAGFGMLGYLFRDRKWIVRGTLFLILFLGFSRNYLGVHTPQDVLVGFGVGILTIWITCTLFAWAEKGKNRDCWLFAAALLAAIVMLIAGTYKSYPLDYVNGVLLVDPQKMMNDTWKHAGRLTGALAGWVLERRFLHFSMPDSRFRCCCRYFGGVVLMLLVMPFLNRLLLGELGAHWGNLLRGFLNTSTMFFFYPLLFTLCERKKH